MKRVIRISALLCVLLLLFTACSSVGTSSPQPSGSQIPEVSQSQPSISDKPITSDLPSSQEATTELPKPPASGTDQQSPLPTPGNDTNTPEPPAQAMETTKPQAVWPAGDLEVHFIDVGQADCILIMNGEHNMLIDAGNNGDAASIKSYLADKGVKAFDYVIATHPHEDHIGSMDTVISNYDIGKLIMTSAVATTKTFEDVLDSIDAKGMKVTKAVPGNSYTFGDASFTIIAPVSDYGNDLNNWSIVLRMTFGNTSFLFTGDAEDKAEEDILSSGATLTADVMKIGHHGSHSSTTQKFLDTVKPTSAVIMCGTGNSYEHPHQETLDKLTANGVSLYRTDKQGTIIATSDGKTIKWNTKPSDITKAPEPSTSKDPLVIEKPIETPDSSLSAGETYILNTSTKKFHYPSCSSVQQMKESNKETFTGSRDDVIKRGYDPCKRCNP